MFGDCFYAITYSKVNIAQFAPALELSSLGHLTVQENCVSHYEIYLHFFFRGFFFCIQSFKKTVGENSFYVKYEVRHQTLV
jgi:hypothetical protein